MSKNKSGKGGGGSAQRSAKKYRENKKKDTNVILNRIRELKRDTAVLNKEQKEVFISLNRNDTLRKRFVLDFTAPTGLRLKGRGAFAVKLALVTGNYNSDFENLLLNESWDALRLRFPAKKAEGISYKRKGDKAS